jgi:tetratricopeptide (TPR) repeat protein
MSSPSFFSGRRRSGASNRGKDTADPSVADLQRDAQLAYEEGRLDNADELCDRILSSRIDFPPALVLKGFISAVRSEPEAAIDYLQRALIEDELLWGPRTALAILLQSHSKPAEATILWRQALAIKPGDADALFNLGECYREVGSPVDAAAFFEQAAVANERASLYQIRYGEMLLELGLKGRASEAFRRGGELDAKSSKGRSDLLEVAGQPTTPEGSLWLAKIENQMGLVQQAHDRFVDILGRYPDFTEARAELGLLLQQLGHFSEGEQQLRKAIDEQPDWTKLYTLIISGRRIVPEDTPLIDQMLALLDRPSLDEADRGNLHAALGKAFDNLGQFESAMSHFDNANRIVDREVESHAHLNYRGVEELVEEISSRFSGQYFDQVRAEGCPSDLPIFIVGMVRSGTTLTEQILSSHPNVAAGGEQLFWFERWKSFSPCGDFHALGESLARWGEEFVSVLRSISSDSLHVTDKQPENYWSLGLIHSSLPNAKIIHCRRRPIDTALSIYMTPNLRGIDWAHSKSKIVFMYRSYLKVMKHWRSALPSGRMLEIDYEDLVSDPEPTIRRMLEFCNLPWSDACLSPEQNASLIRTPSLWQARQPIYRSSNERWKSYEPWLGELAQLMDSISP